MRFLRHFTLGALIFAFAGTGFGQVATGIYPYGIFDNKGFDTINVGNGNVHFSIPLVNKAGRGTPFYYNLVFDSSVWSPVTSTGAAGWTPSSPSLTFGWHGDTEVASGYMTYSTVGSTFTSFVYHDSLGVSHLFPNVTTSTSSPTATGTAVDGSGYSVSITGEIQCTVISRTGQSFAVPNANNGSATYTDANGNEMTANGNGYYYDTISSTAGTLIASGTNPHRYAYVNPQGGGSAYDMNYTTFTVATDFGISTIPEFTPTALPLVTSILLPGGQNSYTFTYEATPGICHPIAKTYSTNCITGRLASVTLPSGGTISYTYSGADHGIFRDGSPVTLTRSDSTGGNWQYQRSISGSPGPGILSSTTVIDSNSNYTVDTFAEDRGVTGNLYPIEELVYQGSSSGGTLLSTFIQCYNAVFTSCASTNMTTPITQIDSYTELPDALTRLSEVLVDMYGQVKTDREYTWGVTLGAAPTQSGPPLIRETDVIHNAVTVDGIASEVASSTVSDWSTGSKVELTSTSYQYDVGALADPTTTPTQWISLPANTPRGNVTQVTYSTSGSSSLALNYAYYNTGTLSTVSSLNSTSVAYTYLYGAGSCSYAFPTNLDEPLSLSQSATWNCTGGVATELTDENSNSATATYSDANYWRPTQTTDLNTNATAISYNGTNTSVETTLTDLNSGNEAYDFRTTVDSLGRPAYNQKLQAPGGTHYDTSETDYNIAGQPSRFTMPYSAVGSPTSSNTTAPASTKTYDALGRVLTITDGGGGKVSYTYTDNDVVQTVSGGQNFTKEFEYDGMGRLTSVCEVSTTLPGASACGQWAVPNTGYLTKYSYDALGRLLSVIQNAKALGTSQENRSFTYDLLGRMTSETNPESGTNTYYWDTQPSNCASPQSYLGNLAAKKDNLGVYTCYSYDALNRLTGSSQGGTQNCRMFVYDTSSSKPTGVTVANGEGRLIEAYTDTACNGKTSLVSDEWFSYTPRGQVNNFYESTPHSAGYYSIAATYWQHGPLDTLSGIPGVPEIYYGANGGTGLDGEGRYTQVTAQTGHNPATSITYSTSSTTGALGALSGITFGSGDGDTFSSDPNTGRFTDTNSR